MLTHFPASIGHPITPSQFLQKKLVTQGNQLFKFKSNL
jgi:hypothetical protein